MMKTNREKKTDLRRFKPQGPIKPSKKKTKAQRPMNKNKNLTDLIDVDIFGDKMGSDVLFGDNRNNRTNQPNHGFMKKQTHPQKK